YGNGFGVPGDGALVISGRCDERTAHRVPEVPVNDQQIALHRHVVGPHRVSALTQTGGFPVALDLLWQGSLSRISVPHLAPGGREVQQSIDVAGMFAVERLIDRKPGHSLASRPRGVLVKSDVAKLEP